MRRWLPALPQPTGSTTNTGPGTFHQCQLKTAHFELTPDDMAFWDINMQWCVAVLPLEILQSRHEIVVLAEELAQTRRIYIGEKMPSLDA